MVNMPENNIEFSIGDTDRSLQQTFGPDVSVQA